MAFIDQLGLADQQEKLFRITYHVCTRLGRCSSRCEPAKPDSDATSGQVRLPAASGLVSQTLAFWTHFLESQFGTGIPILLALPLERTLAGCDDWRTHHPRVLLVTSHTRGSGDRKRGAL